ncbi:hypothetical protein PVIIG_00105 [Plasmodium vivax India VII]|uniref:C2H2-type domain-containing protein n=7 Tax=Plasmodium vivax TaxID=5855 RepID=A5K3B2_PLAVS|nr:hypothetical protein, conserved [Plasmodium vivax]KMZ78710.1 hypothetical protein PVIIG_00105 [Plasmodium vivax India VII]KMZ85099.1 hypothetical protein PVBG_01498 [Plasmodium vivax Brazil I]KMZ91558.1 hypothetical protein PVMG_00431 [Plasmodium vivax Mauritania I]KMZ98076.1 hypothetical protein PVNG_00413 [Plasmodium vivax North Korean]EDL46016.1 hypothetical protein, conserved [Plasmodium vivax]|eukprot:XP_001615743.1 hypothetical protein [Plasmodium vivax Sal-1]
MHFFVLPVLSKYNVIERDEEKYIILVARMKRMALSTRKKKHPRNTIKSKILKTRKRKRDYDEVYKDYLNQPDLPYDEDKKGGGQHKCYACDIYFINDDAKKQHEKTKKHKRRVKMLNTETPYTYKDALKAAEIAL